MDDDAMLTPDEIELVQNLGECFVAFRSLLAMHPSDEADFAHHVHALQAIVMKRSAQRAFPKQFPIYRSR